MWQFLFIFLAMITSIRVYYLLTCYEMLPIYTAYFSKLLYTCWISLKNKNTLDHLLNNANDL